MADLGLLEANPLSILAIPKIAAVVVDGHTGPRSLKNARDAETALIEMGFTSNKIISLAAATRAFHGPRATQLQSQG